MHNLIVRDVRNGLIVDTLLVDAAGYDLRTQARVTQQFYATFWGRDVTVEFTPATTHQWGNFRE